jgi:hypothetical protein
MTSLAFEIGFDHYRFGLPLESNQFSEIHRKQLRQGYETAEHQRVTIIDPNIFEKKLLIIQGNALNDNSEISLVSHDLTNKLIEAANLCPIIENRFAFSENSATDWTVDRIDHTQGYHLNNIVIISKLANTLCRSSGFWLMQTCFMSKYCSCKYLTAKPELA